MNMTKEIAIIGAGVSGLTSACVLLQHGWKVTIFSRHEPDLSGMDPSFSSLHPAASIIPHSVYTPQKLSLFEESHKVFKTLYRESFPGLKVFRHFELYSGTEPELPAYTAVVDKLESFDELKRGFFPSHPEHTIDAGWSFSCLFADWKVYYPALLKKALSAGARLKIQKLESRDLAELPFDIIVNCSEIGSIMLFDDPHSLILRGHLLRIQDAPELKDPNGIPVSYNYYPTAEVYSNRDGNPQDVYCYSRADGWVWGGSRQPGILDKHGVLQESDRESASVNVPSPLIDLNTEIIQHSFGIDASVFQNRSARVGYRYIRSRTDGLRLEKEEIGDNLFIHNYGHGGAGVTLSWGCARECLNMLSDI